MSRLSNRRQARGFADGIEARAARQGRRDCGFADRMEARATVQGRTDCGFADGIEARAARQGRRDCGFADRIEGTISTFLYCAPRLGPIGEARAARQGWRVGGFTLVELVVILILVSLLAFTVIPRQPTLALGAGAQVEQLAADIRYTQSLAMTHGERFRINLTATSYQITDSSGAGVEHPATQSTAAVVLDSVTLSGYNPPLTNNYLAFDGRGVPYALVTSSTPLAGNVTIILAGNGESRTIVVTPDTGRVSLP